MADVILRAKTQEAKDIIDSFGDVWTVAIDVPSDSLRGTERRLMIESRSDDRRVKGMWVKEKYDDLFEIIWL